MCLSVGRQLSGCCYVSVRRPTMIGMLLCVCPSADNDCDVVMCLSVGRQ